jgi:hypothetical protein
LQIRFSAFIEEEAEDTSAPPVSSPITPTFVPGSPLDGNSILPPDVTVNQDTAGAPQNETAIAVNPNNPDQVVAAANDYVSRTWSCSISGTPCSALGRRLLGDVLLERRRQHVVLHFHRPGSTSARSSRASSASRAASTTRAATRRSRGTPGALSSMRARLQPRERPEHRRREPRDVRRLGEPQLVGADVHQPDHLAVDAERQGVDRGRRQHVEPVPRPHLRHVHALPLQRAQRRLHAVADLLRLSSDGGATFTTTEVDRGNVLYSQGSRPVVGPDGSLYVFWDGARRHDELDSTWVAKSTDGGATWGSRSRSRRLNETERLRTRSSG